MLSELAIPEPLHHTFTIRTLAMLSNFFGKPIIRVAKNRYVFPDEKTPMVADGSSI